MRTLRLQLARHRRAIAVGLVLAALWITLRSALPSPPATVAVLVAAHDLPAGQTLTQADLHPARRPADQAPDGRLTRATGRTLAGPIRAGELLTDARVVGPGLLTGQPAGTVAMPIRLGDPVAGTLVRAGDRVDVLASSSSAVAAWSSEPDLADGTAPSASESTAAGEGPGATGTDGPNSTGTGAGVGSAGGAERLGSQVGQATPGSERVATRALVLAAPGAAPSEDGGGLGSATGSLGNLTSGWSGASSGQSITAGLLVLAVSADEAAHLAAAQSGRSLVIAVLPER